MQLYQGGRLTIAALALLVAGFALGSLTRLGLTPEQCLALLGGAATLLVLAARVPRD